MRSSPPKPCGSREPQISERTPGTASVFQQRQLRQRLPLGKHLLSCLIMFETVVGLQGQMERKLREVGGRKRGLGSRQTTPAGERGWGWGWGWFWPSQHASLLSPALPQPSPGPPPRLAGGKQGGSRGTPWQGPLRLRLWSGGLAGSESASHDQPS